jgi:hypothetical protein
MCVLVLGLIARIFVLVRRNRAHMRWHGGLNIPLMIRVVSFAACLVCGFA